ncbi:porin [Siccirubricoccus sp. KC 17139]|uniref:Porin n=2 Tax=Siccirubricoccus soli TaxID=2899147 RepID=A0ABT1DBW9_9PROT|nr:porin [Siccirubricoccus soli]MCP2685563.1 porin [Siccirubricoccus soli]
MAAEAQEAPTVRVGGYFRAYYGYTQQNGQAPTNVSMGGLSGGPNDSNAQLGNTFASARNGHNDFSTDAEVHVFVNGKTANGLTYGAVIEIEFDSSEGTVRSDARRAFSRKTGAAIDEMYAFIASPTLGQIRFGDEDGPFGGLMNVGWVSNFGTGGAYGDFESFIVRPTRTGTTPGSVGDNTKIIYLSPQFFGFDFGLSYAANEGEGEDTGCLNSFASLNCDRVYAATGIAGNGRSHDQPGRMNEIQWAARWRGSVAGVGLAVGASGMFSQVVRDISATGVITRNLRNPELYQVGAQATYMGFTVGGGYMWGNTNYYYIPTLRGDKDMSMFFGGASYTAGPFTVGANFYSGQYAGTAFTPANANGQRRWAYSIGATYRLAPGLDLLAEFVRQEMKEPGVSALIPTGNLAPGSSGDVRDRGKASVFLTGIRLAF